MQRRRWRPRLGEKRANPTMGPDQRLMRVDQLRTEVRQTLRVLRAEAHGSDRWETCLAQLEPLWRDLFVLLDELEPN